MSWAKKRQMSYLGGIILLFLIISAIIIWRLNPAPSCSDGILNQNETGIDCGGGCSNVCGNEAYDLNILWARPFEVLPGTYDVVAYIENINLEAGVKNIFYSFKLYDDENILITEKTGQTFISPNKTFAIFENGIDVGQRIPKRAFFDFIQKPDWVKEKTLNQKDIKIYVKDEKLDIKSKPTLTATFFNDSLHNLDNVSLTAVLYDKNDNAFAVSSTNIKRMLKNSSQKIVFTWPQPLTASSSRIEIIPRVDPFNIK